MEDNRRDDNKNERSKNRKPKQDRKNAGKPDSFSGMNFEQQRGSYKNSDGAGVGGKEVDGENAPHRD